MMAQSHQSLYLNILEDQPIGVIQYTRAQYPFQYLSHDHLTVDVELPGVIWELYGIWGDTRSPKF